MKSNNIILKQVIKKEYLKTNTINDLSKKFNNIFQKIKKDIFDTSTTLNVLNNNYRFNFKTKDLKTFKKFKTIALIGMGGSILGSEAIYEFLEHKIKKKIYLFNDLNEKKIESIKEKEDTSKVLFIIISKSGNTIETLTNTFLLKIIKKNAKNIIIISEKKDNLLYSLSNKFNLFHIQHNDSIGGRYSVLSEVGIVPALLMGVNISKLRSKSLNFLKKEKKFLLKEMSVKLACLMHSRKFNNLIFLNYSPQLEKFLFWCQQLIAESLGKKNLGFLPVISNVPKDHHSLLQLYLDGPKDKFFTIFSLENKLKHKITMSKSISVPFINNKRLSSIKNAQKNALIKAFKKKNIPFRELKVKKIDEEVLGELFSFFMIETIIVAKLLKINPYDQPAVEEVKIYTKQLLK